MKNITTYTAIVLLSMISLKTNAQQFGIKAGFNLASMNISGVDELSDSKMHTGFHFGGIVDFPINDFLSLETGLLFSTKGFNMEIEEDGLTLTTKINLNYLEIPVLLKGKKEIGTDTYLFGNVGPYFAFGLSGKVKSTFSFQGESETEEEKVEWGNDDESDLKRFDMGLSFGAGVQYNSILLGLSYDLGLSNILAYQEDGAGMKNRVFKISVGYLIGQ